MKIIETGRCSCCGGEGGKYVEFSETSVVCTICVRKARRLISENLVNLVVNYEDIKENNNFGGYLEV